MSNIEINNNSGSITVCGNCGGSGNCTGMSWQNESANFSALSGNGYFVQAGASGTDTVVGTLPPDPALGDTIIFYCTNVISPGVITMQANSGQQIFLGSAMSSIGGSISGNMIGDSLTLTYSDEGATWYARAAEGSWTIV